MSWIDVVDRVEVVRAVFGTRVPRLDAVRLHEVILHQDGPTVILRFDLPEFPEPAPVKWNEAGHNTVQVMLALDDVLETRVLGWTKNNVGSLSVSIPSTMGGVLVEFSASGSNLRLVSKFVRIERLTAYRDRDRVAVP
jgi:hypothetical protein